MKALSRLKSKYSNGKRVNVIRFGVHEETIVHDTVSIIEDIWI